MPMAVIATITPRSSWNVGGWAIVTPLSLQGTIIRSDNAYQIDDFPTWDMVAEEPDAGDHIEHVTAMFVNTETFNPFDNDPPARFQLYVSPTARTKIKDIIVIDNLIVDLQAKTVTKIEHIYDYSNRIRISGDPLPPYIKVVQISSEGEYGDTHRKILLALPYFTNTIDKSLLNDSPFSSDVALSLDDDKIHNYDIYDMSVMAFSKEEGLKLGQWNSDSSITTTGTASGILVSLPHFWLEDNIEYGVSYNLDTHEWTWIPISNKSIDLAAMGFSQISSSNHWITGWTCDADFVTIEPKYTPDTIGDNVVAWTDREHIYTGEEALKLLFSSVYGQPIYEGTKEDFINNANTSVQVNEVYYSGWTGWTNYFSVSNLTDESAVCNASWNSYVGYIHKYGNRLKGFLKGYASAYMSGVTTGTLDWACCYNPPVKDKNYNVMTAYIRNGWFWDDTFGWVENDNYRQIRAYNMMKSEEIKVTIFPAIDNASHDAWLGINMYFEQNASDNFSDLIFWDGTSNAST